MNDTKLIIAVAKLDGLCEPNKCKPSIEQLETILSDTRPKVIVSIEPNGEVRAYPNYLTSRDAIIPVIEKQVLTEEQWEVFLRYCIPDEADWIACNKVWRDSKFQLQQSRLPRAFRLLVLLTAKQLSIALVKSTGNWTEE